ncbi:MAG: hypothetical protein Q9M32_00810 [Sulfurimonas sp.]|nr:hypothetical protein [Sulfurimonas sp.]MDQ7060995.1 hypothetical protein [Sulfurimonas sp.]
MKRLLSYLLIIFLYASASAQETQTKRALLANGETLYFINPAYVDSLAKMITEGEVYGRIRSNTFNFKWANEDANHETHLVSGLGASLVYKSATLHDFDFKTALFYSYAFFNDTNNPVNAFKPGKDTLSRFNYVNNKDKSMAVLGEAYVRYSGMKKSEITLGRQIVNTFYTKPNDTKMVPNTFDALVFSTEIIPDTEIQLAYLDKQKLRDHEKSHAVLMVGDANSSSAVQPQWSENDDSAMHKGLTYSALKAAGKPTDAALIIAEIENNSVKNLEIDASFYTVPSLLSQFMGELNYAFKLKNSLTITPAIRYIKQFDNGAGKVGGASYTGNTSGYKNPDSLASQMLAARIVAELDAYKLNLGYTHIFDEADLITPWRGFPTSGYTRSMGIYNWRANTQSYRLELQVNANDEGIYKDVFIQTSVLYVNGDKEKFVSLDYMYYYLGFVQNIPAFENLQWRLRLGYADFIDKRDDDFNYLDSRFELNYLF